MNSFGNANDVRITNRARQPQFSNLVRSSETKEFDLDMLIRKMQRGIGGPFNSRGDMSLEGEIILVAAIASIAIGAPIVGLMLLDRTGTEDMPVNSSHYTYMSKVSDNLIYHYDDIEKPSKDILTPTVVQKLDQSCRSDPVFNRSDICRDIHNSEATYQQ